MSTKPSFYLQAKDIEVAVSREYQAQIRFAERVLTSAVEMMQSVCQFGIPKREQPTLTPFRLPWGDLRKAAA